MKKWGLPLLAAVLLFNLAGCGAGPKVSLVESQFEALDDLFQRAGAAVAQIDAAVQGSGDLVSAGFGEYYTRLASQRDGYAETVASAKELKDEELDALLASLEGAVDEAKPVVSNLEAIAPEVEKLAANTAALVESLNQLIPLAAGGAVSAEWQQEYTGIAAAYQSLEDELNATLAQAEGGGLERYLSALQQANDTLGQLCERASGLLANLQG